MMTGARGGWGREVISKESTQPASELLILNIPDSFWPLFAGSHLAALF